MSKKMHYAATCRNFSCYPIIINRRFVCVS